MSSGIIVQGSVSGPTYYRKNWSGADGRGHANNYSYVVAKNRTKPSDGGTVLNYGGLGTIAWTSRDSVVLQNKLLASINGHSFNLGTSLVEGPRTMSMIYSTLSKLGTSIIRVKRGDLSGAAAALGVKPPKQGFNFARRLDKRTRNVGRTEKTSKFSDYDISGRWLELQYGWLPLLSDIHEGTKAWNSMQSPRKTTVKAFHRSITSAGFSTTFDNHSQVNISTGSYSYELTEVLSQPRQVGLTDPLSMAWELLPYSFIVDWFIPIGTFLENLNQIPKLTGSSILNRSDLRSSVRTGKDNQGPAVKGRQTVSSEQSVVRTVSSAGVPLARPGFRRLDDVLTPTRFLNALALTAQKFR